MNNTSDREYARRGTSERSSLFSRVAAWLVVFTYVAGMCANFWLEHIIPLHDQFSIETFTIVAGFGMCAVVGALLVAHRPKNVVGWIMCAIGLMVGIFPAGESYAAYVMSRSGHPDALAVLGVWANGWYWYVLLALVCVYLPLFFPDGRLLSRRWLPVAVLSGIGLAGMTVLSTLAKTFIGQNLHYHIANPIGLDSLTNVENSTMFSAFGILVAIGGIGAVASVVVRFHRSRGVERQQLKWFLYAAASILLLSVSDYMPAILGALVFAWVLIGIPTAVGVAVLKYRLYDIDLVINRTLVYGSLTVTLVAAYLGVIVSLQYVFRLVTGEGSQLAVVASTLAIAALFNPLRRRVQDLVDRRFYRRKYDAEKTLAAFSTKLRDETDLENLNEEMVSVVRETMQPEHISLWLKPIEKENRKSIAGG